MGRRSLAIGAAFVLAVGGVSSALADDPDADAASVVVTTEVLGSVVAELVGDAAEVRVLMSGGVDPHSWQPSARQTEAIFGADLIVANGLDLEERLVAIFERASAEGVPVFEATDHIAVRTLDASEHDHETDEDHGSDDPHFWLDPLAMRDVVLALEPALQAAGVDVGDRAASLADDLESLDAELTDVLAAVSTERRKLVTGHDSLGYFAGRYDFSVVGAVVPGRSTSVEPSARDLADLIAAVRQEGVTAVFTEVGTPQSVARALADDAGAQIVELQVAELPEDGTYADLLRTLAQSIAGALSG